MRTTKIPISLLERISILYVHWFPVKFITLILFLININAYGQDTTLTYLDKEWEKCKKSQATYYRKVVKKSKSFFEVSDYFTDGQLQMFGAFEDKKLKIKRGEFTYYYSTGKLKYVKHFVNGKKHGVFRYYYSSGQIESKGEFVADLREGIWTYWWKNGEIESEGAWANGNIDGLWNFNYKNGGIAAKELYQDDEYVSGEFYNENGQNEDGVHQLEPEYPGGESAMMQFIQNNVTYPGKAVEKGIQGIVYIQFVVDTTGALDLIKIVRGIHPLLDNESLRVVKKMPDWYPGIQHNRLVRCKYTLPIHFRF
ncbi:TonB family protein [Crocinitomix catalasitica]|nr:TonB family protein [Crocinitomix catalasitica]